MQFLLHLRFFFHPAFKSLNAILQKPGSVIAKAMKQSHKSAISVRQCGAPPRRLDHRGVLLRRLVHLVTAWVDLLDAGALLADAGGGWLISPMMSVTRLTGPRRPPRHGLAPACLHQCVPVLDTADRSPISP
ncbi:hypothetical protein G8D25_04670 (plasmid) [Ralstonia solanacearum]|nr:hypothetical protein G8D25_04670 [Ralstonia solanacearum]